MNIIFLCEIYFQHQKIQLKSLVVFELISLFYKERQAYGTVCMPITIIFLNSDRFLCNFEHLQKCFQGRFQIL
jgi:hypothetical protein